jgi:hypothetical protein
MPPRPKLHIEKTVLDRGGKNVTAAEPRAFKDWRMLFWFIVVMLGITQMMIASTLNMTSQKKQSSEGNPFQRTNPLNQISTRKMMVNEVKKSYQLVGNNSMSYARRKPTPFLRRNTFNFAVQVRRIMPKEKKPNEKNGVALPEQLSVQNQENDVSPVLAPIKEAGKFYSICRGDRSGSVIADMLYAHAFAFANNLTYAGNCCVTRGTPKADTRALLQDLHWNEIIPFQCPEGVDNQNYNVKNANATAIHPLLLNKDVYRLQGERTNFKPAWKNHIKEALSEYSSKSSGNTKPFEMVVHIRRGDVHPCTYKRRYLPNDHFIQLIDRYTPKELVGRPVHVTIYSESDSYEPLDVFISRNYTIKLDTERLAEVWQALSTADVAILSRSYFSIVPAIINPNVVVATEFFDFDVTVMGNAWDYADAPLVAASDQATQAIFQTYCNNTKVAAADIQQKILKKTTL